MNHYHSQALFLQPTDNYHGFCSLARCAGAASLRLKLKPAFEACKEIGLTPECFSLQLQHPEDLELIEHPAICIAGKMHTRGQRNRQSQAMAQLALLARLKSRKIPLICIYSNHMEDTEPASRELHRDFLKFADHVVFPCRAIKNKCIDWIPEIKNYSVILDPCQVKYSPFNVKKTSEIDAIWFGHDSNLIFMASILKDLKRSAIVKRKKINLTILTGEWGLNMFSDLINEVHDESRLKIRKVKWIHDQQPMQLQEELSKATFCLIPSDPNNANKAFASHNRMVDAISAGCITIASPIKSYLELSKIALVGQNIVELLHVADEQRERLSIKYSNSREKILEAFSPKQNQLSWKHCIQKTLAMKE